MTPGEKAEFGERQHAAWETIQRSHAIANGCFVIAVNRVGFEPDPSAAGKPSAGIEFWGQSFVAAPDGRIVVRARAESAGPHGRSKAANSDGSIPLRERARPRWP